jgi:predicted nucleic acid-binding protein
LAEVLRGESRDASVHRVLSRIVTLPVSADLGRAAGELLGASGLSGHRCAIDSVVAATALVAARPVVLLTSDPDDLIRLVEEPGIPKDQRVAVVHV